MGQRELRRVPLDFDWPQGEVWPGFLKRKPKAPPTGVGFQLWETTSEGSPVSPVFPTANALADWCVDNATPVASFKWTKDQWMRMFNTDPEGGGTCMAWSPSTGMTTADQLRSKP